MSDLIDTTEMYLRTIFELSEEGVVPLRARIAERLGQSGPTVSQTVARMERDGLLRVAGDRHLELTPEGQSRAVAVMRRHRLAECLLVDVIGLDWEFVHDEACRWEHVITERVERRIFKLLGEPTHSPYGNPIPGRGVLGVTAPSTDSVFLSGVHTLLDAVNSGAKSVTIRRLGEPVQAEPDILTELAELGVHPGVTLCVEETDDGVLLTVQDADRAPVDLPDDVAAHVYVSAD